MSQKHRNLPLLLLKTRESIMASFRPILNEHGLTEQQWRVIRVLNDVGPLEPRELCEMCCILSPSMAGILKRMQEVDLIQKIPQTDLRRIMIKLTPKAVALAQLIMVQNEKAYEKIEERLGTAAFDSLYNALDEALNKLL